MSYTVNWRTLLRLLQRAIILRGERTGMADTYLDVLDEMLSNANEEIRMRLRSLPPRPNRRRQRMRSLRQRSDRDAAPRDASVVAERELLVGRRLESLDAIGESLAQRPLRGGAYGARILAQHVGHRDEAEALDAPNRQPFDDDLAVVAHAAQEFFLCAEAAQQYRGAHID